MRLVHTQHGTDVAFSVGCIALLPSECWFMRFYVSWLRLARLLLNLISDDVIVVLPSEKNNKRTADTACRVGEATGTRILSAKGYYTNYDT